MLNRILLLILSFACIIRCQQKVKPISDCQQIYMQPEVKNLGVENLYKEAMWQIYKFTIIESNKYRVENPFDVDSVYTEPPLSEFNLEFHNVEQIGDTTRFIIHFERNVIPVGTDSFGGVAFWDDENKFEIGARFIFIMEKSFYETEFKEYLQKNKEKLSPMLKCLAIERGVLKEANEK